MQSNRRNVKAPLVKTCKFCKDAGKSESEYTSHFLRESKDPNSRITCPTLLAIQCRYCSKKGHTVSKCQKLAKDKANQCPPAPIKNLEKPVNQTQKMNKYDILFKLVDAEDEEEEEISDVSTCVECDTLASDDLSGGTLSYAEILAKPAPQKAEVGSRVSILSKARMMRSWADSDSDEE